MSSRSRQLALAKGQGIVLSTASISSTAATTQRHSNEGILDGAGDLALEGAEEDVDKLRARDRQRQGRQGSDGGTYAVEAEHEEEAEGKAELEAELDEEDEQAGEA